MWLQFKSVQFCTIWYNLSHFRTVEICFMQFSASRNLCRFSSSWYYHGLVVISISIVLYFIFYASIVVFFVHDLEWVHIILSDTKVVHENNILTEEAILPLRGQRKSCTIEILKRICSICFSAGQRRLCSSYCDCMLCVIKGRFRKAHLAVFLYIWLYASSLRCHTPQPR